MMTSLVGIGEFDHRTILEYFLIRYSNTNTHTPLLLSASICISIVQGGHHKPFPNASEGSHKGEIRGCVVASISLGAGVRGVKSWSAGSANETIS